MKSVWGLIASIIQLIVGFAAIISYIIIAINGETMLKWTATLILAIGFFAIGIIGVIDWIKSRKQKWRTPLLKKSGLLLEKSATMIYNIDNTMTTKILTVRILRIIWALPIIWVKIPIQNCLSYGFRERVGIIPIPRKALYFKGFQGFRLKEQCFLTHIWRK